MTEKPVLDKNLDSKTFCDFYYLKKELDDLCKVNLLKMSINIRQVQKEALAYSKQYKKDLITKGGTWVVGGENMDKKTKEILIVNY